ncbi:MAG: AraC family transcriptional regulator [Pseudomonadota bacterium]
MSDTGILSLRSYTLTKDAHAHDFDQIVIPLSGAMEIGFADGGHVVEVGHCVIIPAGTEHQFGAHEASRFLVADINGLPPNATGLAEPCVQIGADLQAFCAYAETQLTSSADDETHAMLVSLFAHLFAQQDFAVRRDARVMRAVRLMEEDLSVSHPVEALAEVACLSVSQFKTVFRKNLGEPWSAYLTRRRMEQAKTLLTNTDAPVNVVALDVGYDDASAFSRRFRAHFGQSPRAFARQP